VSARCQALAPESGAASSRRSARCGNLALDLRTEGAGADAEELTAETLSRYTYTLGAEHPDAVAAAAGQRLNIDGLLLLRSVLMLIRCSWSGCSAGWRSWRGAMPSRTRRSWSCGTRSRSCSQSVLSQLNTAINTTANGHATAVNTNDFAGPDICAGGAGLRSGRAEYGLVQSREDRPATCWSASPSPPVPVPQLGSAGDIAFYEVAVIRPAPLARRVGG